MSKIAQSYKSDYEIALAREQSLRNSLGNAVSQTQVTNQAQVQLRELESAAQTSKALHDNFLQRYMEGVQQQSFPITEARLVGTAEAPLSKSYPKTSLVLLIAVVGGAMLSFRDWGAARGLRPGFPFKRTSRRGIASPLPCIAAAYQAAAV